MALVFAEGASADPLPTTWQYQCSTDLDPAGCERLTYIAGQTSQLDGIYQGIGWTVGVLLVLLIVAILMRTFGREQS